MCSIVILWRPGHEWPLICASNRDEMVDRAWLRPGRHWPDRPEIVAGLDLLAGGSWLGVNDAGLVAGILNRRNALGPQPGKRSRGELVLDALEYADAADAIAMLAALDARAYRPFNMVIADNREAHWVRSLGREIEVEALPEGVSMITAHDRNDLGSMRIRHYLSRWQSVEPPIPPDGGWAPWQDLLLCREHDIHGSPTDAMFIVSNTGFGTVSSSLIAVPEPGLVVSPVWLFSAGRSDKAEWSRIEF